MNFAALLQALCDAGVNFVVIGGLAATIHGSANVTYDLDICYSRDKANLSRLAAALAPLHPRPRGFDPSLPFLWDATTLNNATILTLQTDRGELDLLAEVSGLGSFEEVRTYSILMNIADRQVPTLSLPGLIQAKRATGREKDRAALPELESLLETESE